MYQIHFNFLGRLGGWLQVGLGGGGGAFFAKSGGGGRRVPTGRFWEVCQWMIITWQNRHFLFQFFSPYLDFLPFQLFPSYLDFNSIISAISRFCLTMLSHFSRIDCFNFFPDISILAFLEGV